MSKIFIVIIVLFTLISLVGAFLFSILIAQPINTIKVRSQTIDFQNINPNDIKKIEIRKRLYNKFGFKFRVRDEIDTLTEQFNEMLVRLESTYQKLLKTQNKAIQSEKLASIGILVAGIAHEINNPLLGLLNCIRRISDDPNNVEQTKKYLSAHEGDLFLSL